MVGIKAIEYADALRVAKETVVNKNSDLWKTKVCCRINLFAISNTLNVIFYFFRYIKPNSKKRKRTASKESASSVESKRWIKSFRNSFLFPKLL